VQQAAIAFVSGGLFGRGLGHSYQKFGFLPTPHTDSVFAIVGEELGLVGCLAVAALFVALAWRGFRVAANAQDGLGSILAAGIVSWISVEALINIAVMVNAVPFAGNALPFISYGGSSLVVTLAAIGVLLSISRRDHSESIPRKTLVNPFARGQRAGRHAAFNLSRRNGRRRVPRTVGGEHDLD
jgi:cell division protein FtsW